jgi:outer membrane protein assembly factor BamB
MLAVTWVRTTSWPQFAAGILVASTTVAQSWPQLGGPQRNFVVEDRGLAESWPAAGPEELWRRELGDGYSGIVSADGTLYTMHRDGTRDVLIAMDARTGSTLWSHAWEAPPTDFMDTEFGPGPHSTPLLAGSLVFGVGVTGRLVALERDTGRLVWQRQLWADMSGTPLERGYAASPLAFDDLVILPVGGEGQALVALRQRDGAIAWQAEDFDIAYASPILIDVDGQVQLVALLKTEILGVEPATGSRLWMLPVNDERYVNVVTPYFSDGDLLFFDASAGSHVFRLERQGSSTRPRELWIEKRVGSQVGNVIRRGDHLYGTLGRSAASFLTAVEITTGTIAWRDREIGDCSLLMAGDKTLALESDGTLRMVDLSPAGLATLAQAKVLDGRSWTPPTLVGTTLYLRNRREAVALQLGPADR